MFQEILDEIVDIDLVLNFKCADNCFMKKRSRGDICSHCGQLFDVSNSASLNRNPSVGSYTWHSQVEPASILGLEDSRLERMRTYAKQVTVTICLSLALYAKEFLELYPYWPCEQSRPMILLLPLANYFHEFKNPQFFLTIKPPQKFSTYDIRVLHYCYSGCVELLILILEF